MLFVIIEENFIRNQNIYETIILHGCFKEGNQNLYLVCTNTSKHMTTDGHKRQKVSCKSLTQELYKMYMMTDLQISLLKKK